MQRGRARYAARGDGAGNPTHQARVRHSAAAHPRPGPRRRAVGHAGPVVRRPGPVGGRARRHGDRAGRLRHRAGGEPRRVPPAVHRAQGHTGHRHLGARRQGLRAAPAPRSGSRHRLARFGEPRKFRPGRRAGAQRDDRPVQAVAPGQGGSAALPPSQPARENVVHPGRLLRRRPRRGAPPRRARTALGLPQDLRDRPAPVDPAAGGLRGLPQTGLADAAPGQDLERARP